MLPQVNAQLLSIASGESGSVADWDTPGQVGSTLRWQGSEDAYVLEKVVTSYDTDGGGLNKTKDMSIIISDNLVGMDGGGLNLETGDYVTFVWRDGTHTRRVKEYAAPELPGMALAMYVRVHLDPEPVEVELELN